MLAPAPPFARHPDLAGFLARAVPRLASTPPALPEGGLPSQGDHRLSPDLLAERAGPIKPAAVLIALVDRVEGPTVVLTERSTALRSHSGQIAFPGGQIDAADKGPLDAALREAEEEIGLSRKLVWPLGFLDPYLTTTGYCITPVVALADAGMVLHANPDEVSAIFECPLMFLMDPANHVAESREWRGAVRHYYAMPWQSHYVWGVTAGILRTLYERVYFDAPMN